LLCWGSAAAEHDLIVLQDYGLVDWTAARTQAADLHATDFIV
jgi:hypothetical protein